MRDKVIFLDRDGVINHDSDGFIKWVAEFIFLPRSLAALRLLAENGFEVILISNQSGVGQGIITPENLAAIHRHLIETVEQNGGRIKDILFCPHTPEEGCNCRKPEPGLLFKARDTYGIDLATAAMVGDKAIDIDCARRAGCQKAILVRTGHGVKAKKELAGRGVSVDYLADDLYDAVCYLLSSPFPAEGAPQGGQPE
ncbi:MAG: D-glycero-beta-D-manno-heptose 1,7-bisphosphate 7-phosphatase [Pseudomonadota bacterium]